MKTLETQELNISKESIEAIDDRKNTSPVEQSVLSNIINRQSVVINAKAGEHKNATFAIAAYEILKQADHKGSSVLIITNTSQTAHTWRESFEKLQSDNDTFACVCIDDEGSPDTQAAAIQDEAEIIVAMPDRLHDLLQKHRFIFRDLDLLILDELDEMLEENATTLKHIKRRLLSDYTTCACCKTYDKQLKQVVLKFADEPLIIGFDNVKDEAPSAPPAVDGKLRQEYINVPNRMKISTLVAHLKENGDDVCVIFTASKRGTDRLYRALKKQGLKSTSIHKKLPDDKHRHRFSKFTEAKVHYLIVSDFSASTLKIARVDQVINYDVPNSAEEYRYRAALLNAGSSSRLVSLVSKQDRSDIKELQNELGQSPDEIPLPDAVKQKVKQRHKKKSNGRKNRNNGNKKKSRGMELPKPNYDKLNGGRNGNHNDNKTGIVKFFKKLFS